MRDVELPEGALQLLLRRVQLAGVGEELAAGFLQLRRSCLDVGCGADVERRLEHLDDLLDEGDRGSAAGAGGIASNRRSDGFPGDLGVAGHVHLDEAGGGEPGAGVDDELAAGEVVGVDDDARKRALHGDVDAVRPKLDEAAAVDEGVGEALGVVEDDVERAEPQGKARGDALAGTGE